MLVKKCLMSLAALFVVMCLLVACDQPLGEDEGDPGSTDAELLKAAATALGESLGGIVPQLDGAGFKIVLSDDKGLKAGGDVSDDGIYVISETLPIPAKVTVEVGKNVTIDFRTKSAKLAGSGQIVVTSGGTIKSTGGEDFWTGAETASIEIQAGASAEQGGILFVGAQNDGAYIILDEGVVRLSKGKINLAENGKAIVNGLYVQAYDTATIESGSTIICNPGAVIINLGKIVIEDGATFDVAGAATGSDFTKGLLVGTIDVYGTLNDTGYEVKSAPFADAKTGTFWVNPYSTGSIIYYAGSAGKIDDVLSDEFKVISINEGATLTLKNPLSYGDPATVTYVVSGSITRKLNLAGDLAILANRFFTDKNINGGGSLKEGNYSWTLTYL